MEFKTKQRELDTTSTWENFDASLSLLIAFNALKVLFPDSNLVIGGGAVRDALMGRRPKDIDVFLLNNGKHDSFFQAKEYILNQVRGLEKTDIVLEWHKSEPFLVTSVKLGEEEVQIMARDIKTVDELLDTFDWNVSLFAFDGEKVWYREEIENIGYGKELKLQRCTYPASTLRRGFRFSERFLMKFNKEDMEFICEEIVKKRNKTV